MPETDHRQSETRYIAVDPQAFMEPRRMWGPLTVSYHVNEVNFINSAWPQAVKAAGLDPSSFRVFNCSPDSHITCFEKIDYGALKGIWRGRK